MYQWYSHGSKKLEDLQTPPTTWFRTHTTPVAIFHDQEPLHYDLYNSEYLTKFWAAKNFKELAGAPLQQIIDAHLRGLFMYNGYDLSVLCHSEHRSQELEKYQKHGFVGAYYWSHALIARDWFRCAEHEDLSTISADCSTFLIYGRAWQGTREYRLKFFELLIANHLQEHCLTSFKEIDDGVHYSSHKFKNSKLQISNTRLQHILPVNHSLPQASADYNSQDYKSTQIEVVLETLFDDHRLHLTEKCLRPIACGKPFLLAAPVGSLQFLREYGFQTFSPWINETYDKIQDPADRLQAIIDEMQRITQLPSNQKQSLLLVIDQIAQQNKLLFFSKTWHQKILDEFVTNFDSAMQQVLHGPRGKYYRELGPLLDESIPDYQYYNKARPGHRSTQEINSFLQWINGGDLTL